jgi:DNA-binding NarL/FixJ family response regulator
MQDPTGLHRYPVAVTSGSSDGRIRVLIADDEPSIREALARLFDAEPDLEVVALAGDTAEAIAMARALRPDVAILDVRMPGAGGAAVARAVSRHCDSTRIIAHTAARDLATARSMLLAGATTYVVKGDPIQGLLDAVRGNGANLI